MEERVFLCCGVKPSNSPCVCRNYHVFYYLLAGASEEERKSFHLLKPEEYHYLNQVRRLTHTQAKSENQVAVVVFMLLPVVLLVKS